MSQTEDSQLPELRREITELMGRCVLKLQHYELTLKRLLATSEINANFNEHKISLNQRSQSYAAMTLGQLIKELTGSYVSAGIRDESEEENDKAGINTFSSTEQNFQFRFSEALSEENHASLVESLSELVNLRNELVHHFLSRHSLRDQTGCHAARSYLTDSLDAIAHHTEELNGYFSRRESMRQELLQFLKSDAFNHYVTHGYVPAPPIDWANTSCIQLLKEAERYFQADGWTELLSAIDWIKTKEPDLSPKSYGCSSWRGVLHTSSLFEIRKQRCSDLPSKTLYRSR